MRRINLSRWINTFVPTYTRLRFGSKPEINQQRNFFSKASLSLNFFGSFWGQRAAIVVIDFILGKRKRWNRREISDLCKLPTLITSKWKKTAPEKNTFCQKNIKRNFSISIKLCEDFQKCLIFLKAGKFYINFFLNLTN